MWDKSSWPERVVVIWGLLIASSAVLYVAVSLSNLIFENSSNIASWVQAIGSIGAIFGAFLLASNTERRELRRQYEIDAVDAQVAAIGVVSDLVTAAEYLTTALSLYVKWGSVVDKTYIRMLVDMQGSFALPDLAFVKTYSKVDAKSASFLSIAVEARRQLMQKLDFLSSTPISMPVPHSYQLSIPGLLVSMQVHTAYASNAINEFLAARGVPLDTRNSNADGSKNDEN